MSTLPFIEDTKGQNGKDKSITVQSFWIKGVTDTVIA